MLLPIIDIFTTEQPTIEPTPQKQFSCTLKNVNQKRFLLYETHWSYNWPLVATKCLMVDILVHQLCLVSKSELINLKNSLVLSPHIK